MKHKLVLICHIIVVIIIYLLSFIIPGILNSLIDFTSQIDFISIIIQTLLALFIFLGGLMTYVNKVMKLKLSELRIQFKKPDTFWIIISTIIALSVVLLYIASNNVILHKWESDSYHTIRFITHLIFVGGILAGISEEILFRGFLMGYLEKKIGIIYAIIISSILFGLPHLLDLEEFTIQIIIHIIFIISLYGAVLSLLVYYTNNIWNSISFHILWNIITGIIINKGENINSNFVLQLTSKNLLWNGGDFGIEISIVGLTATTILGFLVIMHKRKQNKLNLI